MSRTAPWREIYIYASVHILLQVHSLSLHAFAYEATHTGDTKCRNDYYNTNVGTWCSEIVVSRHPSPPRSSFPFPVDAQEPFPTPKSRAV